MDSLKYLWRMASSSLLIILQLRHGENSGGETRGSWEMKSIKQYVGRLNQWARDPGPCARGGGAGSGMALWPLHSIGSHKPLVASVRARSRLALKLALAAQHRARSRIGARAPGAFSQRRNGVSNERE